MVSRSQDDRDSNIRKAIFDFGFRQGSVTRSSIDVIVSACVSPPANPKLARSSSSNRIADYLKAISYLIALEEDILGSVIVLENSGFDPDTFGREILRELGSRRPNRNFEVLSCTAAARPDGLHYGYSEFQMFDVLLDDSEYFRECTHFIKITGRYIYPKVCALVSCFSSDLNFVCDSKNIPAFLWRKASQSTSVGLFYASKDFFNLHIRHLYLKMNNEPRHTHIEDIIFDRFHGRRADSKILLRFPVECAPSGIGGNGDNLNTHSKRIKSLIRSFFRKWAPSIWI